MGLPRLYKLLNRPAPAVPKNWIYNIKIVIPLILASLSLFDLMVQLRIITFINPGSISLHDKVFAGSIVGSTSLLFFWLFTIVTECITLRTSVLIDSDSSTTPSYNTIVIIVNLILSLVIFVLENLPKPKPYYSALATSSSLSGVDYEHVSPEVYANIFSRLTFHWVDPLMKLGYEKDLEMDDLWDLRRVDSAEVNSSLFANAWEEERLKKNPSLLWAVAKAYGLLFCSAAIFKPIQDLLSFIQPTFLRWILEFTSSWTPENKGHEQPLSRGVALACLMLSCAVLQTFILHQYFHICILTGMRLKSALITAVYRKALKLSSSARQKSTVGEIVNLMAVDAGRLGDLPTYLHIVWSGPFQICLALYFLYGALGPSIFAGVAVMILMIPINGVIATWSRALNKQQMGNKDKRTKIMDELLSGIKVIKLYAWEIPFLKKVSEVREQELFTLRKIGVLAAGSSFTWACTPFLVSFLSFALYSATSEEPLTSSKVFVSLALFNLLQFPLTVFPNVITSIIESSVAFNRLRNFLLNEELDPNAVSYHQLRSTPGTVLPADGQKLDRVVVKN
ncbi:hypothetical protein HDU76_004571, partial [Blyttiomyces sp. JEL0837]